MGGLSNPKGTRCKTFSYIFTLYVFFSWFFPYFCHNFAIIKIKINPRWRVFSIVRRRASKHIHMQQILVVEGAKWMKGWSEQATCFGFITTHFGFYDLPLKLYINQKRHMRLMISELLDPCHFTHLVPRDIQLQNPIILMIRVLIFLYNNEISYHH